MVWVKLGYVKWLKFFQTTMYFFDFGHLQGETGIQNRAKSANFGSVKVFETMSLLAKVLPLLRISTKLDHIWGSKGPKTSQIGSFCGC